MTPKEKAKELMNRFEHQYNLEICEDIGIRGIDYEMAKQCALIAAQYIITSNPHSNPLNTDVYSTMKYWEEVKKEIDEL